MTLITITAESPRQPDVIAFIKALDDFHNALYPPESNHSLDIETLCRPEIRFFVARREGEAMGSGALWVRSDLAFGEVKRMFVRPEARGLGIGRRMIAHIESEARREGLDCLRLETGTLSHEALRLYAAAGFTRRGPFAEYVDHPMCVFMEKGL